MINGIQLCQLYPSPPNRRGFPGQRRLRNLGRHQPESVVLRRLTSERGRDGMVMFIHERATRSTKVVGLMK